MKHWADEALVLEDFCQTPRTKFEIASRLGVSFDTASEVIAYHRLTLSGDTALIHEQPTQGDHWYVVTGDPERITRWVRVRLRDGDSRLRTILEVALVAVRVTDGRTGEGRRARRFVKHIGRLIEDIDEILADETLALR